MSTKTTFKRVALVAVAALGFGTLSSVAPASAAASARTASSVSVGATSPARAGVLATTTVTLNYAAALEASDSMVVSAKVISAPATSQLVNASSVLTNGFTGGGAVTTTTHLGFSPIATGDTVVNSTREVAAATDGDGLKKVGVSAVYTNSANVTKSSTVYLSFKADVAGTYQVLVSQNASGTAYAAGDASTTWTITTTGTPTSIVMSTKNATHAATGSYGSLIKVNLLDAAGNVTVPGINEAVLVTAGTGLTVSDATLTAGDFSAGTAWINATSAAAVTSILVTATGSGLIPSTVTSNISISSKAILTTGVTTSINTTTATTGYAGSGTAYTTSRTSHPVKSAYANTATDAVIVYAGVTITDTDGRITGKTAGSADYVTAIAVDGTSGTTSFTADLGLVLGYAFTFTNLSGTANATTITGAAKQATSITPDNTLVRSAEKAVTTIGAVVKDQFSVAMPNVAVTYSVSGRNTVASTTVVSDANGRISVSVTDAGTLAVADSIAFSGAGTASVSIVYGTVTVGTVTVTGGATADTVAYPNAAATTKAITTASTGANGGTTTFTATVKDAAGNLLAGVPVTWTVDKATAGITKSLTADSAACVTGAAGTCTTTAFSWAAPSKVTVTATAGGKTGTGYQNFVNAATDARVLSATVSGALATAKVVDRFGNVVAGVTVSAKTSNGYFGSGATSTTGVTTTDGTVGFALTGAGTVTLSLDAAVYTQSADIAGEVDETAVTAAVAGTTTGTGASLAPAGVNTVSVEITEGTNSASQAAADAAAEATDAANAATDAANAAAEAADAATAAAQDAADAVAALSAQVATLISGLKAQLTALTNLVIKIQKKVKA
jgi:hypothetical protein